MLLIAFWCAVTFEEFRSLYESIRQYVHKLLVQIRWQNIKQYSLESLNSCHPFFTENERIKRIHISSGSLQCPISSWRKRFVEINFSLKNYLMSLRIKKNSGSNWTILRALNIYAQLKIEIFSLTVYQLAILFSVCLQIIMLLGAVKLVDLSLGLVSNEKSWKVVHVMNEQHPWERESVEAWAKTCPLPL